MNTNPLLEPKVVEYIKTIKQNADIKGIKCLASQHKPNGEMLFGTFEIDSPDLLKYVFIRGDAVSIAPEILVDKGDGKADKFYILVEQRRVCDGRPHFEFPAGMMDRDSDPTAVARKELEEETGLVFDKVEALNGGTPLYTSPGACDEKIYLFKTQVKMSQGEFDKFYGEHNAKLIDNGDEKIKIKIVKDKDVQSLLTNTINLAMLYFIVSENQQFYS